MTRAGRRIVLGIFDGVQVLDATGPLEVFSSAARLLEESGVGGGPAYRPVLVAPERGPVRSSSGIELVARGFSDVRGPVDTLLVAGGHGTQAALRDGRVTGWLRRAAPRARRVGSVCSGAFFLAAAGLLDGRRVTTHWRACDQLAEAFPRVQVDPDPIFIRDGRIYTSAGVCAGIDLALALVEEDHGRELALAVARQLVVFLKRPGGQSQFSAQLEAQLAVREPLRELQTWIVEHPHADLSVDALARKVAMSPRHFARVFGREVGATPARFVERARVEAARRRLEESDDGVERIAADCGFGSAETLRRAFVRRLRVTPADYRLRFHTNRRAG